ncbi:MAG: type II 3-dehydroquinate dehydratase, partial [Schleiferiaceae bacterium]
MIIHIVHGVNLDRLGVRQNEFYGSQTLEERIPILTGWLNKNWPNVELRFFQSNLEGEVVNYL